MLSKFCLFLIVVLHYSGRLHGKLGIHRLAGRPHNSLAHWAQCTQHTAHFLSPIRQLCPCGNPVSNIFVKKNVLMPSRNVVNKTFWTFYPNVLAEVVFSVALRKKNASTNRFHRIIHDTSGQVPSRINIETLRCRVLTFLTRIGIWTHGQSVCNYYWPVCLFSMPLHQHIFETVL
jgi:hypothetical protein